MLRAHTLFNHRRRWETIEAHSNFARAINPWAHLQDSCSDPMTELHQIDNTCEDQTPCESIRDSRCSRRCKRCGCVMMNVLWPDPLPERGPRCETWKWSPTTTFSAARLTWSKSLIKPRYSQARNLASLVCSWATVQHVLPALPPRC